MPSGSTCPTLGVPGAAYTAAQFDGQDDALEIETQKRTVEIYSYDFQSGAGSGWSKTNTSSANTANGSTKFLGTFGNETVNLDLNTLPTHDTVEVSFDLFVPGSWDGDRTDFGPDNWEWGADGTQIFKSNFSNGANTTPNYQFYPANWCANCSTGWYTGDDYGVHVYRDYDSSSGECSGISQTISSDVADLSTQPIGDNTISCQNYSDSDPTTAIMYRDTNYGGTAWMFDPIRGVAPSFDNDSISSIRVWPSAHSPQHGASDDTLSVSGLSGGAIYQVSYTISNHTANSLNLYFQGETAASDPEVWGLDNVVVTLKSDYTSVPLANSSFTLSAWAKPDTTSSAGYLISQGSTNTDQGLHL